MTLYKFLFAFSYISIGSAVIPIVAYIFTDKSDRIARYVFLLLFASLASDLANRIYIGSGMQGYLVANIFFAVQFCVLGYIYASLLSNKRTVYAIMATVLASFIVYSAFFQSIHEYQNVIIGLESFFLIGFAVRFSSEVSQALSVGEILKYFPTWVNLAVFQYFGFNLFLLLMAGYIFKNTSPEVAAVFWGFHNLNNIIKNVLLATGIYVCLVKRNSFEPE